MTLGICQLKSQQLPKGKQNYRFIMKNKKQKIPLCAQNTYCAHILSTAWNSGLAISGLSISEKPQSNKDTKKDKDDQRSGMAFFEELVHRTEVLHD